MTLSPPRTARDRRRAPPRPCCRRGPDKPTLKIGVLTDLSGPYKDLPATARSPRPIWRPRIRPGREGYRRRNRLRRPPEQARCRRRPGAPVVRPRRRRRDPGRDEFRRRARRAGVAKEKNKVFINSGAATSDLTGAQCNANTIHWVYDTYMLSHSTGGALVKAGGDSWFFIVADYAFGQALQRDTSDFVEQAGGKVLGACAIRFPAPPISPRSCCRRRPRRQGARSGQRRRGRDQPDQAGARSSASKCASPGCWCSSPTCTRWGSRWRRG